MCVTWQTLAVRDGCDSIDGDNFHLNPLGQRLILHAGYTLLLQTTQTGTYMSYVAAHKTSLFTACKIRAHTTSPSQSNFGTACRCQSQHQFPTLTFTLLTPLQPPASILQPSCAQGPKWPQNEMSGSEVTSTLWRLLLGVISSWKDCHIFVYFS